MKYFTSLALCSVLAAGASARVAAGHGKAKRQDALVLPDGRIAPDAVPEDFNVLESVFKSAVVKGDGTCICFLSQRISSSSMD